MQYTSFIPSKDDMESQHYGVLVTSLGDDGGALAITHDKRLALEALDTYYQQVCGQSNLFDDPRIPLADGYFYLDSGHAVFSHDEDGYVRVTAAAPEAEHAVPVVWLHDTPTSPAPAPYDREQTETLFGPAPTLKES